MLDSTFEIVQFVVRSNGRATVLESLSPDASLKRSQLQREHGIPRSTVSRILSELETRELVSSDGNRYEVTPFGGFVVKRLHSICCSIEAMQQLQSLLSQISNPNPHITFAELSQGEIVTPTSVDPDAPARRLSDLLHAASLVRLIIPTPAPILFALETLTKEGMETFEVVIPRIALEVKRAELMAPPQLRDLIASNTLVLFSYDGDIAYVAGTIDETAIIGLTDHAGTIQGYVETSDETVRSWTASSVEAYQQSAECVNAEFLTT